MSNITEPEKEAAADVRPNPEEPLHKPNKSLWEIIDEIIGDVPEVVLNSLPADGAERHDHYLHGERRKA